MPVLHLMAALHDPPAPLSETRPVRSTDDRSTWPAHLREQVAASALWESLQAQSDQHWRLWIVADAVTPRDDNGGVPAHEGDSWAQPPADDAERHPDTEQLVFCDGAATSVAHEVAAKAGDLFTIVDTDDWLHPSAVQTFKAAFEAHPSAVAAYADSTTGSATAACNGSPRGSSAPQSTVQVTLRPAWNLDLALSTRYTGDPFVVTAAALGAVTRQGWEAGTDEFARHDLMLRASETQAVLHIPAVLCHRATGKHGGSKAAVAAAQAYLDRNAISHCTVAEGPEPDTTIRLPHLLPRHSGSNGSNRVTRQGSGPPNRVLGGVPVVSVVVPTAATPDPATGEAMIRRCLASLATTRWPHIETILVVGDECRLDGRELSEVAALTDPPARIVRRPAGRFNFSEAVNLGALAARGPLLVLLNDDTEVIDPDWMAQMWVHAEMAGVGAVGARLLFADGTVQHTGVVIDDTRPLHPFAGWDPQAADRRGWGVARTVCAVTGAAMMTGRSDFLAMGGFTTKLPLAFNDIDYCLRLAQRGLRTVVEPAAVLVHHEGRTRATTVQPWEWNRFAGRWGLITDPWYHPGFVRPGDIANAHPDADHQPPAVPPAGPSTLPATMPPALPSAVAAARTAEIVAGFHKPVWAELRRLNANRAASEGTASVAPMSLPEIDTQLVPTAGPDPIHSDDPAVLRREILRLRDGLGGAQAQVGPLRARVAQLEEIEALQARYRRLVGNPMVRAAARITRPLRRAAARMTRRKP